MLQKTIIVSNLIGELTYDVSIKDGYASIRVHGNMQISRDTTARISSDKKTIRLRDDDPKYQVIELYYVLLQTAMQQAVKLTATEHALNKTPIDTIEEIFEQNRMLPSTTTRCNITCAGNIGMLTTIPVKQTYLNIKVETTNNTSLTDLAAKYIVRDMQELTQLMLDGITKAITKLEG